MYYWWYITYLRTNMNERSLSLIVLPWNFGTPGCRHVKLFSSSFVFSLWIYSISSIRPHGKYLYVCTCIYILLNNSDSYFQAELKRVYVEQTLPVLLRGLDKALSDSQFFSGDKVSKVICLPKYHKTSHYRDVCRISVHSSYMVLHYYAKEKQHIILSAWLTSTKYSQQQKNTISLTIGIITLRMRS